MIKSLFFIILLGIGHTNASVLLSIEELGLSCCCATKQCKDQEDSCCTSNSCQRQNSSISSLVFIAPENFEFKSFAINYSTKKFVKNTIFLTQSYSKEILKPPIFLRCYA
jgi:hypothetical protein